MARRRGPAHVVLGVDLSLRSAGLVALPFDFVARTGRVRWERVLGCSIGEPLDEGATEAEHAARMDRLAREVVRIARDVGATAVALERLAYSKNNANASRVVEATGAVKLELWRELHLPIRLVACNSARKLLLGRNPRRADGLGDPKKLVVRRVRELGAPLATEDECDAFVCANWLVAELGGLAIVGVGLAA